MEQLSYSGDQIVVDGKQMFWFVGGNEVFWYNRGIKAASRPCWPMDQYVLDTLVERGIGTVYVAYAATDSDTIPVYKISVGGIPQVDLEYCYGRQQFMIHSGSNCVSYVGPANDVLSGKMSFNKRQKGTHHRNKNEA